MTKGYKYSEEVCKQRSDRMKIDPPMNMLGRRHSESTKMKMREKAKKRIAELNNRWKGGGNNYFHTIARAIYYEHCTNPSCEVCFSSNRIHIHHKDEDITNNDLENLQALCQACHNRVHHLKSIRRP